jgi:hypothetical protein
MKAVFRLVYLYFMATPMTRALTIGGLVSCLASMCGVTYLPQSQYMMAFAWAGQMAFFLGSSLMPLMVGRLARSHASGVLPHARWKLLLSMLLTVIVVALPALILAPFALVAGVSQPVSALGAHPGLMRYAIDVAFIVYTSLVIIAGWLYVVMWFLTSERNAMGFAKGMLVIVIMLFMPAREIQELSATMRWNLEQLAVAWTVFGALFLHWRRLKNAWARRGRAAIGARAGLSRGTSGREVDLILGTANPWLLIAAQLIPIFIASRIGIQMPVVWLYFLTIFSTVTGAISGQAAERSRVLWLRLGWSRAELFSAVEQSFWRHNCVVLGVLLLLMVGIGSYAGYPTSLLAAGLPLLILGTALSTYLGLMITRGLRWPEACLGILIMLTLMSVPLLLEGQQANVETVVVIEILLAGLVLFLRTLARKRWGVIDWMACRPSRSLTARGA